MLAVSMRFWKISILIFIVLILAISFLGASRGVKNIGRTLCILAIVGTIMLGIGYQKDVLNVRTINATEYSFGRK